VYGYHTETITSEVGHGTIVDTDTAGVPYVTNKAGFTYFKNAAGAWTKKWDNTKELSLSP
jgi:hypothetical protein